MPSGIFGGILVPLFPEGESLVHGLLEPFIVPRISGKDEVVHLHCNT